MSFETIWHLCASGIAAFAVTTCAIAFFVKMKAHRAALTRLEHQQAEILRYTKHATEDYTKVDAALSALLAWHQKRAGEPGNDEVVLAIDEAREELASQMNRLAEMHVAAAATVAQSIGTALPHLRRFSEWYSELKARLGQPKEVVVTKEGVRRRLRPQKPPPPSSS